MRDIAYSILKSATEVVPHIARDAAVIQGDSVDRPTFTIVHQHVGLVSVEVGLIGETPEQIRPRLNDKVERLLAQVPTIPPKKVIRISVLKDSFEDPSYVNERTVIVGDRRLTEIDWNSGVRRHELSQPEFELLISHISPQVVVTVPRYEGVSDRFKLKHRQLRLALDVEQSEAAKLDIEDILMVSGSPGTGRLSC